MVGLMIEKRVVVVSLFSRVPHSLRWRSTVTYYLPEVCKQEVTGKKNIIRTSSLLLQHRERYVLY
jgi:hypothetical protein